MSPTLFFRSCKDQQRSCFRKEWGTRSFFRGIDCKVERVGHPPKQDADTKLSAKIEDKHQATVKDAQSKSDKYDAKTEHGTHQERKNDPD